MTPLDGALWSDLVGKPYQFRGRGPASYDCYGLLIEIYRRRGIAVQEAPYDDTLDGRGLRFNEQLGSIWTPCEIYPGAALVFGRRGAASHVGVAIDQDRFIHASEDFRTTLVSYLSRGIPTFQRLLISPYEYRGS